MLQKLNERIQGLVAWVIIILITITFTLFGLDYYLQSHNRNNVSVEVNGETISQETFDVQYRRLRSQQDLASLTPAKDKALKARVLDELVINAVSIQAAKKYGFEISQQQANHVISAIPQFKEDGKFSMQRYQQMITRALYTSSSFLDQVQQGMLLNQVRFALMGTAFVLPSEVKRFVKLNFQSRDFEFLQIPYQVFIPSIKVSQQQIQHYYKEHGKEFLAPETLSVNFVRLSTDEVRKSVSISNQELKRFYKDNISSFKLPSQWKVAQIFFAFPDNASEKDRKKVQEKARQTWEAAIKNPNDFQTLVQQKSDDKLSLPNKGVLPWITAGQTSMDAALVTLKSKGDISKPFESKGGYHLFKLMAYKPSSTKSFAEVMPQIKQQLISDRVQTKFADQLEKMTELAFQSPDTLQPISKALGLPIETSGFFSRKGSKDGISKNKKAVNAAFSHDVLSLGNNSEPLQLNANDVIVLRVNTHNPSHERPLNEVTDRIKNSIIKNVAITKTERLGKMIINNEISLTQAQSQFNLQPLRWIKVTSEHREDSKPTKAINAFAFSLADSKKTYGKMMENGSFVAVKINAIKDGNYKNLDAERKGAIRQQLQSNFAVSDYDLYIAGLMAGATIKPAS